MSGSSQSAGQSPSGGAGEWYKDGLRFSCTQCGNCCSGPPGYVWFTEAEGVAIASHLGITESQFQERYARRFGRRWSLKDLHVVPHGHDCVFLDRSTSPGKAMCSIYQVRPQQCRTWPFWPENVASPEAWDAVKKRTPCPGMGQGKLVSIVQIRIQRDTPV